MLLDPVRIGDGDYLVVQEEPTDDCDGEFCAKTGIIRITPTASPQYKRYLLAHEIVHGLLEHAGALDGSGKERFTEEQVACIIGRALPDLLKNNPRLVEYFVNG